MPLSINCMKNNSKTDRLSLLVSLQLLNRQILMNLLATNTNINRKFKHFWQNLTGSNLHIRLSFKRPWQRTLNVSSVKTKMLSKVHTINFLNTSSKPRPKSTDSSRMKPCQERNLNHLLPSFNLISLSLKTSTRL